MAVKIADEEGETEVVLANSSLRPGAGVVEGQDHW